MATEHAVHELFACCVAAIEVKRHECRNIKVLSSVSRDMLCSRFVARFAEQAEELDKAYATLRKLGKMRWSSVAWQHGSAPEGQRYQKSLRKRSRSQLGEDEPATGGRPCKEWCKAELARQIQAAENHLFNLLGTSSLPSTRFAWKAWVRDNLAEIRERMPGSLDRRRQHNTRLTASPDLKKPVPRIQPQADRATPSSDWAGLLQYRTGWFGLVVPGGRRLP